ncbi:lysophospholipid acyltransferase 1 [Chelonus insularis]|uniref:lysophospholipid acyltransferase 1 n=1 Tax=Chelonus insularis TaxID=460826 RepID=UPI0015898C83|nr:lysophospholipid acyltransferase 1 [Chelonus insularis]
MAVNEDLYYSGSHIFDWVSDQTGIPVDQVNFVISQFTSLFLAGILRIYFKPQEVGPVVRHSFGLIVGLSLGYFCFGWQALHLAGLPALCYIVIRTQDPRYIHRIVLVLALGYLSFIHIYRIMYTYGYYTLDITGPLMVITQKVTSTAFNIHDGIARREEDLTPLQKRHAIKVIPSALEYFAFIFQFQTLLAGPAVVYCDYIDYIHGNHFKGHNHLSGFNDDASNQVNVIEPSPTKAVINKILQTLICGVLFISLIPMFPLERVKESDFIENTGIIYKLVYLSIVLFFVRARYYYAWLFADAICNNSGMGFNGLDDHGQPRWDGTSNVDYFTFELSTNLKDATAAWNKGTTKWLREIVYERVNNYKLLLTFALSSIWHGFYPGYYLTFATGALFTYAARIGRRKIRPLFVTSADNSFIYDVLTFVATRISMTYLAFTFALLEFTASVRIYKSMYLIPHLMALAIIIFAPLIPTKSVTKKGNSTVNNNSKEQLTCDTNSTNIVDRETNHNGITKKTL